MKRRREVEDFEPTLSVKVDTATVDRCIEVVRGLPVEGSAVQAALVHRAVEELEKLKA